MLKEEFKTQIKPLVDSMQEVAFTCPILTAKEIDAEMAGGKFNRRIGLTPMWFISITLSISPTDDDTSHFWHCSVAFINNQNGKPMPAWAWSAKYNGIATDLIRHFLREVGDDDIEGHIDLKTKKIARHGYKQLSEFEIEHVQESAEIREKGLPEERLPEAA